jgi:hypothetical protein
MIPRFRVTKFRQFYQVGNRLSQFDDPLARLQPLTTRGQARSKASSRI